MVPHEGCEDAELEPAHGQVLGRARWFDGMHELVQQRGTSGSVLIKADTELQRNLGDDCMFKLLIQESLAANC